ncbi:MAG: mechanosensitive ion channel family protein [Acidimicrobiia bacterium]
MSGEVIAAIAVGVGGIVVGSVVSPIVRKLLQNPKRPEAVREIAPAAASFVFWALLAFGLIMAIGMTSPETLKPIPSRLVAYFPKVLTAGVLLLLANVASTIVALAIDRAMLRATGQPKPQVTRIVKAVVLALGAILAVSQLGIDTTIVNLLLGALVFSVGASSALLVGLGGRDVARHLAAGRYLRRVVRPGDSVTAGGATGVVRELHPLSVEVELAGGERVHLPNAQLIEDQIRVNRS